MYGSMIKCDGVVQDDVIGELKDILTDEFPALVNAYIDDANDRLAKLQSAAGCANAAIIRAEAHSLKGSSINLGAKCLAELLGELEDCGSTGALAEVPELLVKIKDEFSRTQDCLRRYL